MTRARMRESMLVLMLALTLAVAPLMIHHANVAWADPGDTSGGYSCDCGGSIDNGGSSIPQQIAGATIITLADGTAIIVAAACGFCGFSEWYDYTVAIPATLAGLYLIFGDTAYASGCGCSGFDNGYAGGGGGGASNEVSYSGGSW